MRAAARWRAFSFSATRSSLAGDRSWRTRMGRLLALLAALIVGSWIAFVDERLPESLPAGAPAVEFAGERAFADVNFLAAVPHPIASPDNANVRDALVGRMLRLGLS